MIIYGGQQDYPEYEGYDEEQQEEIDAYEADRYDELRDDAED